MPEKHRKGPAIEPVERTRIEMLAPSGVSVWSIVSHLKDYDWNVDEMMAELGDEIEREDVDFAVAAYREKPGPIDRKLRSLRKS